MNFSDEVEVGVGLIELCGSVKWGLKLAFKWDQNGSGGWEKIWNRAENCTQFRIYAYEKVMKCSSAWHRSSPTTASRPEAKLHFSESFCFETVRFYMKILRYRGALKFATELSWLNRIELCMLTMSNNNFGSI